MLGTHIGGDLSGRHNVVAALCITLSCAQLSLSYPLAARRRREALRESNEGPRFRTPVYRQGALGGQGEPPRAGGPRDRTRPCSASSGAARVDAFCPR